MLNAMQSSLPRARRLVGGFWELAHQTLMMVGLFVVAGGAYLYFQPQAMSTLDRGLTQWVMARKAAGDELQALAQKPTEALLPAAQAAPLPTEVGPALTPQQRTVSNWLARRYSIAPTAMSQLVSAAYTVGKQERLDPLLLLAVMAVESSFNPYAASGAGATGLMQVMAGVHRDKFARFGGPQASIDPLVNVRVGAVVLKDAISRGGSVRVGLRYYVGATTDANEGGYADKVLAEQAQLERVAGVQPKAAAPMTASAGHGAMTQKAAATAKSTVATEPSTAAQKHASLT
ncbi:lytic transglycosylase domain-containing protein [Thiomonas bhubaneswarensis]|uniref:Transglycosylase SLT domain n=1 Tax=Thiomonas bhubaneswarensis TaxID=339866 RepID=A0A0K6HUR9_9BURK|nr:lytic transglycosylase domain-containing protein [Thiomonas bhubaneswarensis]CUA94538.1 Transglycosylase SLT domain [Thiomonas bhubaneswarensis]